MPSLSNDPKQGQQHELANAANAGDLLPADSPRSSVTHLHPDDENHLINAGSPHGSEQCPGHVYGQDDPPARIAVRHLAPEVDSIQSSMVGESGFSQGSGVRSPPAQAGSSAISGFVDGEHDQEGYQIPYHRPGAAMIEGIYKWANQNRPSIRRLRSESLAVPRTSSIDSAFDTSSIREPGGFRRNFMQQQAAEQGRPQPRALQSFIDFLSLYGHFAGEDLDDLDAIEEEDTEGEEERDDLEAARPGALPTSLRREGVGRGELDSLLAPSRGRTRTRSGPKFAPGMTTEQRIRSVSQARKLGDATVTEAVLMLLKSFVGTGILFLGKAFFNGGLAFSVLLLAAVSVLSLITYLLLIKSNLKVPASFGDMGGILYGPRMRIAILASITLSQIGFVAAYTVFVAQTLQSFILAVTQCRTLVPIGYLILVQQAAYIPLSLVRRIARLSGTALIADAFILFGIVYLFQFEIRRIVHEGVADVVQFNRNDFPLLIGTAVFTFEGVGLIIPITESMREPHKLPEVLSWVIFGVTILFAVAGALGYAAFGSNVQTVVITNLPQHSPLVKALQASYAIAILLSIPLQLFPALSILERGIFGSRRSGKFDWRIKVQKNVLRVLIVCSCALLAWAGASDLDKFVSLIGSVACVPLGFIYPPLIHLRACATRWRTRVLDCVLMGFGIACLLFAGSQTIAALAEPRTSPKLPMCTPPT